MIDTIKICNYKFEINSSSKTILLGAFLLAADQIASSLCYNILKKCQIPLDIFTKLLPIKVWSLFDHISKKNGQAMWNISSKIQLAIQSRFPSFRQSYERPLARILLAPIYEEILIRMVLQEIFLRQIPKLILTEQKHLVDLKGARIFRVILSSTIFALLHTDLWGKGSFAEAGINTHFIGGITFGIMTEQTHGVLYSTLMHMFHNLFAGSSG